MRFRCNNEILEVYNESTQEWEFVIDCCESLWATAEAILSKIPMNITIEESE